MKLRLFALLILSILCACKKGLSEKTYIPRQLAANEDFNNYPKQSSDVLTIVGVTPSDAPGEAFQVKYKDTLIRVQPDEQDSTFVKDRFSLVEVINTQKTAVLAQLEGSLNAEAPFFLITVKDGKVEVVSLYRASQGAGDQGFTKGMMRIGKSAFLINNDYVVTPVNARVYLIPRQNEAERLQGHHFINSKDKKTLVFLLRDALYQVHYPTATVYSVPAPRKMNEKTEDAYKWIQKNYRWVKNGKGIEFLKYVDDDAIVDISSFKK